MAEEVRWGVIGTGNIAKQFARGLEVLPDAELVAVGSRAQKTADEFAEQFGVPNRHPSYQALAEDPDVDAVYVATPHTFHRENSILCLEAGKAVLCEKPFSINAREAEEVVQLAREKKLFLMEAMWTRFLPMMVKLRELLKEGVIGEVRMLHCDFGFRAGFFPQRRLLNPALGGGALLDVGVYTVSLSSMIFGTPTRVAGLAHLGETGVDEQSAFVLAHEGGRLSVLSTAVRTSTPQEAVLLGTDGRIRLHSPWWRGSRMTVSAAGKEDEVVELPYEGNGYNCEAEEVGRRLREGKLESETMPLDETVSIMKTLDRIRKEWGLKYPVE